MRIGFLLGSGVSLSASLPSTDELTRRVLSTSDYVLNTDGHFFRKSPDLSLGVQRPALMNSGGGERLGAFLESIGAECQKYFEEVKGWRAVNYEDLYYAVSQIGEHLQEEYENPAIEPLVRSLLETTSLNSTREQLKDDANLASRFIADVVSIELATSMAPMAHLACLVDALRDLEFDGCDIITLNHDTLIEQVLNREGISFFDGFGRQDGDVAWWSPGSFEQSHCRYLLKLHGSLDWWTYDGRLAKALCKDLQHAFTADKERLPIPDGPRFLIGTFNKIRDYAKRPYFDLWAEFRKRLDRMDWLIVSGYSFGDKGVNGDLVWWLGNNPQSRLIVLAENSDACVEGARGAIWRLWYKLKNDRFLLHPNYLGDCSWHELKQRYLLRP